MLLSSLKRNRKAALDRSRTKPTWRSSSRPWLEPLEERLAPATRVWDGGSPLNSNWTTAANWVGDVAPVPGIDSLEFPSTAARKTNTNDFAGAAFLGIAFTGSNYVLGGNPLTLGGNLTTNPGTSSDYINLSLILNGDRTFQLGASSVVTINGVIGDSGGPRGFTKAGTGLLVLHGANTYAGLTQVNEGPLYVEHPSALGATTGGTTVAKGAAIRLINIPSPVVFPPEPLTFGQGPANLGATLGNSVSDATWTGPVTLDPGENNLVSESGKTLRITGAIGGAGGFRHIASGGILEFAGTAPNTYAGATEFARGAFRLHKPAGVTAIPGALSLGTNDASAGVLTLMAANQIADSSTVTIVGGSGFFGTLSVNGFAETIGSLSGTGGHVLLGSGALTTGANNLSTGFGGDITGTGSLTKLGSGTFTLTGSSTYSGPTTVSAGNLRVNGSITSAVTVSGSGTLSGSGVTGGVTASTGVTVSPGGTGPGILTAAGSVALGAGSSFVVELNGTAPGSGYDQLRVTGAASTLTLAGNLSVRVGFAPAGQSFTIIDNGGSSPIVGRFNGLREGAVVRVGSTKFHISYRGGDGNDVVLTHIIGAAPGDIEWLSQFGGTLPVDESAQAVAADGNLYVVGETGGTLPGQSSAGGLADAFVRKYDAAGNELWTRQFGSSDSDAAVGVAVSASGVYVVAQTHGTLPGQASAGDWDVFVRKYDADGNELWSRQFGSAGEDDAFAVAADATGVYVAGDTNGALPGQGNAGRFDAFVRKFDAAGNELWTRQFGTGGIDVALGVAVDASGVYLGGFTDDTLPDQSSSGGVDAFVRKYDAAGNELWTRQFGTGDEVFARGIAVSASGVYVAGFAFGAFPGQTNAGDADAFVRKFDAAGNELWTREFGSAAEDDAFAVAADATAVYVAGETAGTFAGAKDAFVRKFDAAGNELWTRQFGSDADDSAYGVAADASGVYVAGLTGGNLPGQASAGAKDAFVRKFDAAGNELWTRQFGTGPGDEATGVAVHASGVYVIGYTFGSLPGQASAGDTDAFVRKYDFAGNELWTRQFGTDGIDVALGVAADASGVYVAGYTEGTLPGQTGAGGIDAFVRKYDFSGNVLWTRQFGSAGADSAHGVAADASGVYVVGGTGGALPGQASAGGLDAFVRKYDADGNESWTRQFGTPDLDEALGVAADASGVYLAGDTDGTLPGQVNAGGRDAFVRKYDGSGNELWTRQFGTETNDRVSGVSTAAARVYLVGDTGGTLPGQASAGGGDAFVRTYDADGNELWTQQFGTDSNDEAFGAAGDASGVYVAGATNGALPGQTLAGSVDPFVRKYDVDGNELWTRQFGTSERDLAYAVAVDASGVYVAGGTYGIFPGQASAVAPDAFVTKLLDTPALIGSGGRGGSEGAGSALTPEQLAQIVASVSLEFTVRSSAASAPLGVGATAMAVQVAGAPVPKPPAAAVLGSEWQPVREAASPRPKLAPRVLEEGAPYSLEGALWDELARSLLS
jgi:autotransporter-associated beta strand protein